MKIKLAVIFTCVVLVALWLRFLAPWTKMASSDQVKISYAVCTDLMKIDRSVGMGRNKDRVKYSFSDDKNRELILACVNSSALFDKFETIELIFGSESLMLKSRAELKTTGLDP